VDLKITRYYCQVKEERGAGNIRKKGIGPRSGERRTYQSGATTISCVIKPFLQRSSVLVGWDLRDNVQGGIGLRQAS